MKKVLSVVLALLMIATCAFAFSACGGNTAGDATPTTPEVTQPGDEGKYLKVLTIGHSLAVDCGHMLALVAAAEGYEGLTVGTLYYSGCPLNRHVQNLTNDTPDYRLYLSSTDKPNTIPATTQSVTMQYALELDYWDIVVMQAGVFEVAESNTYTCGDIQKIQNYVREHAINPNVQFAWHMPWVFPTDNDLRDMYDGSSTSNPYYSGYLAYGDDRTTLYNAMTKCVTDHIMTDTSFDFMIPTGTAMENALSSYWEEKQLHRDYAHATDVARVMSS